MKTKIKVKEYTKELLNQVSSNKTLLLAGDQVILIRNVKFDDISGIFGKKTYLTNIELITVYNNRIVEDTSFSTLYFVLDNLINLVTAYNTLETNINKVKAL